MGLSVVAVRHVHFEHLGTFAGVLERAGWSIRIVDAGVEDVSGIDPSAPDLLVVLGGPIGAYEEDKYPFLRDELRLLEQRLASGRPVIGICLGAQLMARALGARVYPGPAKEIGWHPLTLTAAGQESPLVHLDGVPVLHWHGDTFDLPQGAQLLASTDICRHQAFALGRNVLGLQFHAEVDAADIERWLIGHASEIASAGIDVTSLRAASRQHGAGLAVAGDKLLTQWLAGLDG
jgi:GMP synthase (glutamine-hydrolysing)